MHHRLNLINACHILLFTVGMCFTSASPALALTNFTTQIDATYIIDPQGMPTVKQTIGITNNTPSLYVSEYTLTISSTRLKDVNAITASGQTIPYEITTSSQNTTLKLEFPDQVVGRGKIRTFTVSYTNLDVAQKNGSVLEVSIPKLETPDAADAYHITLLVPIEFGPPAIITPNPDTNVTDPVYRKLTFTDTTAVNQGVSALFGNKQTYNFTLHYFLQNPTITPVVTQIALPPDTPYQQVLYDNINPEPASIERDRDGNWLATYNLEAKQTLPVTAAGSVITSVLPQYQVPEPDTPLSDYTLAQKYWEVSDPNLQSIATTLNTPKAIYTYLVDHFQYDYARIDNRGTNRLGAAAALKNPSQALCLEFSDAFIALARARGIPARLLTGYAYTENEQLKPLGLVQDVLHAWPEYYDSQALAWKPVDPTWGNTTSGQDFFNHLDFSHIVFAIQGTSSSQPYPAGYYKDPNNPTKDVDVSVAATISNPHTAFQIIPKSLWYNDLISSITGDIILENLSNHALYEPQFVVNLPQGPPHTFNVPGNLLLPYAHVTMPLNLTPVTKQATYAVTFSLNDHSQSESLKPFNPHLKIIGLVSLAALLVLATTLATRRSRRLLVSRPQKKGPLRR